MKEDYKEQIWFVSNDYQLNFNMLTPSLYFIGRPYN